MNYLINSLLELNEYKEAIKLLKKDSVSIAISGPSDSQKAHLAFALCQHSNLKGIYIAHNEMNANKMYEDFSFLFGEDVVFFPSKEVLLYDVEARSYESIHKRLKALSRIIAGNYKMIVTSPEALIHKMISKDYFNDCLLSFKVGDIIDLSKLTSKLIEIGYERVDIVEGPGQFAIRGGIIDLYSIEDEFAYRIELFDNEIDSIRSFDCTTQRSIEPIEYARVIPAREIIYKVLNREKILNALKNDLDKLQKKRSNSEYVSLIKSKVKQYMDKLKNDYYFAGIDKLIPYIIDNPSNLLEYIDNNSLVFADETLRIKQRIENLSIEHNESCKSLMEKGHVLPSCYDIIFDFETINRFINNRRTINLNIMQFDTKKTKVDKSINIPSKLMSSYRGHIDLLVDDIKSWKKLNFKTIVLAGNRTQGQKLVDMLLDKDVESVYSDSLLKEPEKGQIVVTRGNLNKGFEYPSIGLVVVSDKEVLGHERKIRKVSKKKQGDKIKAFTDLKIGDFVVHQAHGIGQYMGIEQLIVDKIKKDYLKIRYKDGGNLYIPTTQLDLIQKYIGSEGKEPKVNKLGSTEWEKTKNRVKESLKVLAGELIKLQAKRQSQKGHSFSKDTIWQKQFEDLFPYDETPDQLKSIEEIKVDMESCTIMDRLLCGDVGYGKTEVAIRAVFKAVMDGKQVAYLVPTTILASQQYSNFSERVKDFPVTVELLSRFRTPAQQKNIIKEVKAGNIDVLVGTHKLFSKELKFKDLGLLVIDEEQRFGVEHKEKIKALNPNIDILTLTATPIPRTLHMSLVGIRDISTIEDPPEERYPVQTYVIEYNNDILKDAIERELARKGQVFYLYNRVRGIDLKTSQIQALVPEARVAHAHGQMSERQLEDIMSQFLQGEFDVLICTTIIESGLDLPNVNTIIVEDADKMGLAQLYQIRGRVGRSNRVAFAYLTYRKDKILSEVAEKRLQAIREYTEFGSGFKIAMRDLEIRGAGNLLGPEQHGHMETVGYDMYCKLLEESVKELKGEVVESNNIEIAIDLNLSAYIDNEYIKNEKQKIEMYKKIASIDDQEDVLDVEDELIDRYGEIPIAASNLIKIAYLKKLAIKCGFISIQEKGDAVVFQYAQNTSIKLEILSVLMGQYKRKLMFSASKNPYISLKTADISRNDLIENIKNLLHDIIKLKLDN